jgi:hypothetical protein
MKMLLGDFSAKVDRVDSFKPTIGNESLHEISNDSGVRVVNFATLKKPYCQKYDKFAWTSADGKTHNQSDIFLYNGDGIQIYLMSSHSGQQIVILTTT